MPGDGSDMQRLAPIMAAMTMTAAILGGCASEPDATLLGVMVVPPGAVPAAANAPSRSARPATQPTYPQSQPQTHPAPAGQPGSPRPGPSQPGGPVEIARAAAPGTLAYANPAQPAAPAATPALKSEDEVSRTEAELRALAQRREGGASRGLWNSQIRALLDKRDTHADRAIEKIEGTGD